MLLLFVHWNIVALPAINFHVNQVQFEPNLTTFNSTKMFAQAEIEIEISHH